jgi:hypothetical protein
MRGRDLDDVGRATGDWEKVATSAFPAPAVWRLPVEGGWLYYLLPDHREPSAVFVPEGQGK